MENISLLVKWKSAYSGVRVKFPSFEKSFVIETIRVV